MDNKLMNIRTKDRDDHRYMTSMMLDREVMDEFDLIVKQVYKSDKSTVLRHILREWVRLRKRDKKYWKLLKNKKLIGSFETRRQAAVAIYNLADNHQIVVDFFKKSTDPEKFLFFMEAQFPEYKLVFNIK